MFDALYDKKSDLSVMSACLLPLRPSVDGDSHWYKFDDGDVSECIMDDDEVRLPHFLVIFHVYRMCCYLLSQRSVGTKVSGSFK